jgi:gliding motility-associated lipoprotein GldH
MSKKLQVFVILLLAVTACVKTGLYEKISFMPEQHWEYAYQPEFKFEIKDTSASYKLYFLFRHDNGYAYNNLWVSIDSKLPGDSSIRTF